MLPEGWPDARSEGRRGKARTAVPAVILAGGLSRRMGGGDKTLLDLAGRPLLAHVIARLRPQVGALALNANGAADRFAAFGLPVLADGLPGHPGPLAGVLAGLEWARAAHPGAAHVLTAPGDAPFLPADLLARLEAARAAAGADIAVAASGGRTHPVCALWPVALAGALRHALAGEGMRKVGAWMARFRVAEAAWPAEPADPFVNINRPEDLDAARRIAPAPRS